MKHSESSENTATTTTTAITRQRKQTLRKEIRSKLKKLTQDDIITQSSQIWNTLFELPEYQSAQSVGLFLSMPKGEIMTEKACTKVLADGKTLYVPRVGLDFEKCDMDLVQVQKKDKEESQRRTSVIFYDSWPRNKWGIPEPPIDQNHPVAKPGDIDLLVVPGLGFDRFGGRLGQGKGYYDRFILKMKGKMISSSNCTTGTQVDEKSDKYQPQHPHEHSKPILCAVALDESMIGDEFDDKQNNELIHTSPMIRVPTSSHDYLMDCLITPKLGYIRFHKP
eukprot:CAMPEP_0184868190 /NCGR_PEP_ID=MMETSP0580-20130426/29519_1 /TAXON_ID=1118495 /ORGANISM="Dactyliosolen fragilissimus" /LENGTH=278 /DNA_ID=CAMNT_0027368929 /DNA_START=218 /DNA_END=1054 /DNA_ORIENTATION=-